MKIVKSTTVSDYDCISRKILNSFDCSFNSTSIYLCSDNTDPNVSTILSEDLKICDTKDILCDEYENITPNLEHDPINRMKNIKK